MARSVGLSIENVAVVGVEGELAEVVRLAAMVEPGENMFRADPHVIKRRVESTRRVVNVSVYRLWPDQIQIYAYPAEPVALWNDGKSWSVVDGLGRQMTGLNAEQYALLPKLVGNGGDEAAPILAAALSQAPDLRQRLLIATRIEDRRWDFTFDTGVTVRLPLDADLTDAVVRLAELQMQTRLLDRSIQSVDLRIAGKAFIQPAPSTNEPEAA